MNTQFLSITWSTSRGADTYGYNICKLSAGYRGQVFRTCGGGYARVGTVVGDWLAANYQDRLLTLKEQAQAYVTPDGKYLSRTDDGTVRGRHVGTYGMCWHQAVPAQGRKRAQPERVTLDGACGINCMQDIAKAIGLSMSAAVNRRGHVTGYMVTDYGSGAALKAATGAQS